MVLLYLQESKYVDGVDGIFTAKVVLQLKQVTAFRRYRKWTNLLVDLALCSCGVTFQNCVPPTTQKTPITPGWVVVQKRSLALWIPEKKFEE